MEEKLMKQHVPAADRDVTAVDGPKRPWTKPTIRIMRVAFTADSDGSNMRNTETDDQSGHGPDNYIQQS